MAGMQFEYDEEGGTFFYFLISFWAIGLFPATYFFWPKAAVSNVDLKKNGLCTCGPCSKKRYICAKQKRTIKPLLVKSMLAIGWIFFFILAYKVSLIQLDYVEYDPYVELELDRGASSKEIRSKYRELSRVFHPDKETGDEKRFIKISKAYAALTDEESKKNWEEYGNPDGPEATRFGIALPKWIVERENSMLVLAVYGLMFMVILPVVVGVWWHRSIKFSSDKVLLDTTRLFYFFINKTPNMILRRAVMILAASYEFDRMHNAEVQERPSDNVELPQLIKILGNVQEKYRERPLCFPYSVKARVLLHAHFQRSVLNECTLGSDQAVILMKCPYLVNEMVNICASLVAMAMSGRVHQQPRLETVENLMKLSQMIVQALDEKSSPLQQLPHISLEVLRHFSTRKRNIRHIQHFVGMDGDDRRQMLRLLSDSEYSNVTWVCGSMPLVEMHICSGVMDDEDSAITVGSIVTVTVNLLRKGMSERFLNDDTARRKVGDDYMDSTREDELISLKNVTDGRSLDCDPVDVEEAVNHHDKLANCKPRVWEKQKKPKRKGAKGKKKMKQQYQKKASVQKAGTEVQGKLSPTLTSPSSCVTESNVADEEDEDEPGTESGDENNALDEVETVGSAKVTSSVTRVTDKISDDNEDDDWDTFKMQSKKANSLNAAKKESHSVHCPYFPGEKQEAWWLYVADRKKHTLITAPVLICSLKEEEEVKLQFSAPAKPGVYHYTVMLRSDSYYADFDQQHNIKLDVKEEKAFNVHTHWDMSEDEKPDGSHGSDPDDDSDYSSEFDASD